MHSSSFLTEFMMTQKLKEKDIGRFHLFFQDIIYSSPTGNYLIFENKLEKLENLSIIQSKQIIDVVQYLYDCNIIHRDIRPSNLMLDNNKRVKLIDFGFAVTFDVDMSESIPIAGTITYASLKFLNFCSQIQHSALGYRSYYYEKIFDLLCAINVIIYMVNTNVQFELNKIEPLSNLPEKIPKLIEFWGNVKNENKKYLHLLNTINESTDSPDFDTLKDEIKELY